MRSAIALVAALLLSSGALAQTYVGDQACSGCHANFPSAGFFDGYMNSGHPWKLFHTEGNVPDANTYPNTPLPPLPVANSVQLQWTDIEYIIGNYYWKARFVDRQGYIWTGNAADSTQWNLETQEWVQYHPAEVRPFNCGRCHTTGYDPAGNQGGLPGIVGTWTEEGIRCEACHGPASDHVANTSTLPPGGKDCSECHYRDDQFRMPWSGGFMRHHQQAEDLSHSPHAVYECTACHDPHRSVVYNDGGMIATCSGCHPGDMTNNNYVVTGMESLECIDCHMPFMGKSAIARNAHTGDIRGHLFQIMTDPIAAADNVTGGFWNQDLAGDAFVTVDYACMGCHLDIGQPLTLSEAATAASGIHTTTAIHLSGLAARDRLGGVEVSWATSLETNHDGFNVYRATRIDGHYAKLNGNLVRGESPYRYVDDTVERNTTYYYKVGALDTQGHEDLYGPVTVTVGGGFGVSELACLPNPIHQRNAQIQFTLPTDGPVQLAVFDVQGRLVQRLMDEIRPQGRHTVDWETSGLSNGVYFYRVQAGGWSATEKVVITH